jgi:hypothetical protein
MEIEEYVNRIRRHLPITFGNQDADSYMEYVTSSSIENFNNEKFQFSFLGFHLLYMCYIYKEIWQGKTFNLAGLEEKIKQKCNQAPYDSPFRLSTVPEKEVIPFLNHYGFHQNKTKQFTSSVEWRDNCAHASGFIQYGRSEITKNMDQVLDYVEDIQKHKASHLANVFERYFRDHFKPEDTNSFFPSGFQSIDTFIKEHLLSLEDLSYIAKGNKQLFDNPSSEIQSIYRKVFLLLILGWIESNYEAIEGLAIREVIGSLSIGIEKQDGVTIEDLINNELADIFKVIPKKMRSKSEGIIANCLEKYNDKISYAYEEELPLEQTDHFMIPDFTIRNLKNDRFFCWEHLSIQKNKGYRENWESKLEVYIANGFILHSKSKSTDKKILIMTESDSNGEVDSKYLDEIIRMVILA